MNEDEVDLDEFLLGQESDASSSRGRTDGSTHSRRHSSQHDGGNMPSSTVEHQQRRAEATRHVDRRSVESRERHADKRKTWAKREELATALSSGDDESITRKKTGYGRLKPSLSGKRENKYVSPMGGNDKEMGRYQPGEEVEARFGGRSKWFPGRIRRAYEAPSLGVVYDIAYDDGDMEEEVLAGRVRRPGQNPPKFHMGLQVDIKLGRKGKGYHHGVIGRVNDDGSLYIKFDDGDTEWSLPVQHAIASYTFTPAPEISTARKSTFSNSVNAASRRKCGSGKGDRGDGSRDASTRPGAEKDKARLSRASSAESRPHDQLAPSDDITRKAGPSPEPEPPRNSSEAQKQSVSASVDLAKPAITTPSAPLAEEKKTESSGLSWIVEVDNSVERSIIADDGQPNSEGSGTGWTKTVGHAYKPFSTGGQLTGVQGMARGVSPAEGSSSASITAYSLASSSSILPGGSITPGGVPSIPQTTTPSHLTWTPSKHSTAGRQWGARPSDDEEATHVELLSSPRLFTSVAPVQAVASKPAYSIATISHTAGGLDGTVSDGEDPHVANIAYTTGDDHVSTAENLRLTQDASPGAAISTGSVQPLRQDLANDAESVKSGSKEHHNGRIRKSDDEEALAKMAIKGEARTFSQGSTKSTSERDAADVVEGRSPTPRTQLTEEGGPARNSAMEYEQGGSDAIAEEECSRSKDLRAYVQRRYAADAVHLSEEVRLLRAKLKAADDSARAKLTQQARELKEQIREAIEFEQEKTSEMMSGEMAACARRVIALRQENDTLKRRLSKRETELAAMTAAVDSTSVTMGGRHGSSNTLCPTCGHTTSRVTHRNPQTLDLSHSTASKKESGGVRKYPAAGRPRAKTERLPPPMTNEGPTYTVRSTSASRGSLGNADPALAEAMPASAAKKDGLVAENLGRLFPEGMTSRDKSIRALAARLEELEGKCEGASASRRPSMQASESDWRNFKCYDFREESTATTAASFHLSQRQQHQREETPWRVSRVEGASGGAGFAGGHASAAAHQNNEEEGFFSSGRIRLSAHESQTVNEEQQIAQALRRRLVREQKEKRRQLKLMKEEVARAVQQSRARADRAEAAAASAEETARAATLRYLAAEKARKK